MAEEEKKWAAADSIDSGKRNPKPKQDHKSPGPPSSVGLPELTSQSTFEFKNATLPAFSEFRQIQKKKKNFPLEENNLPADWHEKKFPKMFFREWSQKGLTEQNHALYMHACKKTYAKERVQTAVVHEFGDDHDRIGFGDHTLQVDHIRMIKLSHDGSLGQKVHTCLVTRAGFQGLDRYGQLSASRSLQLAATHITEFACLRKPEEKNEMFCLRRNVQDLDN